MGRDEETDRQSIRHQEQEDQRLDQLRLWRGSATFRWRTGRGAALATPFGRFERLTNSMPPALPGDCYSLGRKMGECNNLVPASRYRERS